MGDIIGEAYANAGVQLAAPLFRVSAAPDVPKQHSALLSALYELSAEEPLLDVQYETGEREIDLSVTGAIQLEVLTAMLKERYGLSARFSPPAVIYKETPAGEGFGLTPIPCQSLAGDCRAYRFAASARQRYYVFFDGSKRSDFLPLSASYRTVGSSCGQTGSVQLGSD